MTVIRADGKNAEMTVEGRTVRKVRRGGPRESTTVGGMVEIFRNRRSRR